MSKFLKQFNYLPKSDRRAILAILVLITFCTIALFALNFVGKKSNPVDNITFVKDSTSSRKNIKKNTCYYVGEKHAEVFYFDPNTADSTQLLRLGLQPWQVRNIYKYRAKGGVYRCKEDFAYVYGLTVKDYRRLSPYIKISSEYMPASSLAEVRQKQRHSSYERLKENESATGNDMVKPAFSPKIHKGEHIAINSSDTIALKKIPGIGSYYARQTIRYREQLGGFVSKKQLLEIDNFPEDALDFISIDSSNIRKLKINKLTLSQLKRHPYINYYQARAITDYRRLHGEIQDIRELRLMKEFSESDIKRIEPYIEY